MAQELFELLQTDHDRVRAILDDLAEMSDGARKAREESFNKLRDQLLPHMQAEEEVLYPALEQKADSRDLALEAIEEHHVARMVLSELGSVDKTDKTWGPKLKVFQEILEHHIEEEESEVFDAAEDSFDERQLQELYERLKAAKQEARAATSK